MSIYDFKVKKRDGSEFPLSELKGKVILVVNTATGCGFTPQYEGLEKLYEEYHDKGFEILDFPCNQFAHQAPETNDEIHNFCVLKYDTKFDQLAKIEVNGDKEDPFYTYIKKEAPKEDTKGVENSISMKVIEKISKTFLKPEDIKWNFTKFLIDREGNIIGRFAPTVKPEDLEVEIKKII